MIANINAAVTTCGITLLVHTVSSTQGGSVRGKAYYQHRHPAFEVHYVAAGQCKAICNGKSYTLQNESILLVPPGAYHDVLLADKQTVRLSISFSLKKGAQTDSKTDALYNIFDRIAPITADLRDSEPKRILTRMLQLLDSPDNDTYRNDKLLALCNNLLLELIPYITDISTNSRFMQTDEKTEDVSFKIDDFLGTNFMYNNAKSRMASELYISPRQLQRIIQKNYGMSYRQKLSETRVQIAIDLLRNTDMQIHKIAEILGYSCSANFSAFMKRATGKTPSQIRKERQTI